MSAASSNQDSTAGVFDDYPSTPAFYCDRCKKVVACGLPSFQSHLKRVDHVEPFVCGQNGCRYDFKNRRSLYQHLRDHHKDGHISSTLHPVSPIDQPVAGPSTGCALEMGDTQWHDLLNSYAAVQQPQNCDDNNGLAGLESPGLQPPGLDFPGIELPEPMDTEEDECQERDCDSDSDVDLEHSALLSVMSLRGITYMTGVVVKTVQQQCFSLMQKTATALKKKVLNYFSKSDQSEGAKEALLQSFDISDPFQKVRHKKQQLKVFQDKFGLIPSQEINLAEPRFDNRHRAKRQRLETVQLSRSFQYVSVIEILKSVMSNPELRKLILSEKASDDDYMRSFRDGSLYADLPEDLKDAVRIILYVDDVEILQGLSVSAGVYKVAGIYFGIQNLPPEINALLTSIFVTALAYAADAKGPEVWEPFLRDMRILETEGAQTLVDNEPFHFKAVLIAQIGDTESAHMLLGLGGPSCGLFCRCCYVKRNEMWKNCLLLGEPRTLLQHLDDASLGGTRQAVRATGVKKDPLIHQLRFFNPIKCSIFDCFHDILQGVAKMEVKLALRHYVHVKKHFNEQTLNSRMHFFDYGFPDRRNKPSAYMTEEYISNVKSYNLHLTGSQMWCFMRAFGFLFGDLVPEDDKFMTLISLLNQITRIVFAHAISESDLDSLSALIEAHHILFMEIFPDGEQALDGEQGPDEENEEEVDQDGLLPEEVFEEVFDEDDLNNPSEDNSGPQDTSAKKKPRKIRMINKHHHMLHYCEIIRMFGPLVLYMCMRYEARHYFFKLAATVSHNFINVLKTLMEMLQMKLTADKLQDKNDLVIGKRGTKIFSVCDAPHSQLLCGIGLDSMSKVFKVQLVTQAGVEYRPSLFVTLTLEKAGQLPQFAQIQSLYVDPNEDKVYVVAHKWQTARFVPRLCAFLVYPGDASSVSVYAVNQFPTYRLLAPWKRYDSPDVYLAPRTTA